MVPWEFSISFTSSGLKGLVYLIFWLVKLLVSQSCVVKSMTSPDKGKKNSLTSTRSWLPLKAASRTQSWSAWNFTGGTSVALRFTREWTVWSWRTPHKVSLSMVVKVGARTSKVTIRGQLHLHWSGFKVSLAFPQKEVQLLLSAKEELHLVTTGVSVALHKLGSTFTSPPELVQIGLPCNLYNNSSHVIIKIQR